ncbi:hypothetical protein F2P81_012086 [Scophthalmus maximus]|uniref:Uncharacterized protein n=1 Tax=Scophthalmus maximus TaxID=52904 RepID=A0A6A4T0K1_SCOMX|nr:hypothetical protein F2P81_012086 [Scophthalmus maximus]
MFTVVLRLYVRVINLTTVTFLPQNTGPKTVVANVFVRHACATDPIPKTAVRSQSFIQRIRESISSSHPAQITSSVEETEIATRCLSIMYLEAPQEVNTPFEIKEEKKFVQYTEAPALFLGSLR